MSLDNFHPVLRRWFLEKFRAPTDPQRLGWPAIASGRHTLIAAPTGSGKTRSAFMVPLDRLLRSALAGDLRDAVDVLYVSPLKALSNDIRRNLVLPLLEIEETAKAEGLNPLPIRVAVRTGDTPASERQAMVKRPPQILVTTPESLYLLLTSSKSREILRSVKTVIVDEIHALARDKRGSHLTLTLERLDALCLASDGGKAPTRIGLSATQRPMDEIARFLIGAGNVDADNVPRCEIVDVGHLRTLDLGIEVPPSELEAVCSHEQWGEVYERIVGLIQSHRSTLVFVNTRRLAERVTHHLAELLGEEAVASHHGSLSRQMRHSAEQRLKDGELKAVVATASLEMGIDVGYIDLVIQIGSPRSIATFLQRIGRSGHSLGVVPKGRLFPLTRDELVECMALLRAARCGRLDTIEIPQKPLDILAQQITATVASDEWDEDALFAMCRRAWPFRDLGRGEFDEIVKLLHEGMSVSQKHGMHIFRDVVNGKVRPRRHARLTALMNGGAIPELADYRVVTEEDRTVLGSVNEDFAIESLAGDVFQLGNTSWRIKYVRGGEVVVNDAHGAPASIPFWLGEAPGRTDELSTEVSLLRQALGERVHLGEPAATKTREASQFREDYAILARGPSSKQQRSFFEGDDDAESFPSRDDEHRTAVALAPPLPPLPERGTSTAGGDSDPPNVDTREALEWLQRECPTEEWALQQVVRYIAAQKAAVGFIPTRWKILFERFFDESGGMQVVIHAPLGARVTRAWGLAMRKRFCRSFDFELQASADDDGFVLAIGPQHSFPIDALFKMLNSGNGEYLLTQALLAAPMFETRWRWNASRALVVARMKAGKKVPPHMQRFKADDFLAAVFPAKTGCFENHHGDIDIPDHPLVRQTIHDCHTEAMDLKRWLGTLDDYHAGKIEFVAIDTREPSPMSHELVNANPYAFLDDAPLEERRARAVATRRGVTIDAVRDLGRLEPAAIEQVCADAWPTVRDPDELHDALLSMVVVSEVDGAPWREMFEPLRRAKRALTATTAAGRRFWVAAERASLAKAIYADARFEPELPAGDDTATERSAALIVALRGWMPCLGPIMVPQLAERLGFDISAVGAALESLEGEGVVLRGSFTPAGQAAAAAGEKHPEWCDRRLLARIHRMTLDGLRKQIKPVEPSDYLRFLLRHQRLTGEVRLRGRAGLREVIEQLEGLEIPAGAWESRVLASRVTDYDPLWLDELSLSGEVMWGRLKPPRRDEEAGPSAVGLNRVMPIALAARTDIAWLVPPDRNLEEVPLRGNALDVLDVLRARGALFYHDLVALTGLLPDHLDMGLYELAAQGLASSDAFGAVRALTADEQKRSSRVRLRSRRRRTGSCTMAGRWSLFPGALLEVSPEERVVKWAWHLLKRWGIVFRDLLERETCAPPWWALVSQYRRMEARGEIRGGRFIAGVGGEQFALGDAVEQVRKVREEQVEAGAEKQWLILSAADPLNLTGIILPGPRLPAVTGNSIAFCDGRIVAVAQAGEVRFLEEIETRRADELLKQLKRTG
ncbi:MAG: DEAD/DEAH box helicase [Planctomycetia bacterium]|nr:DEAD/DEAH box helicase [Planctomycetia bacterium]